MPDLLHRLETALAGRYAVERELGAGGMATVYLAEDLKHHRRVAVKVLRPDLAAAVGPERFLREIEVAAALRHPNILPVYDSGDADGLLYYVMPYVEGEALSERIRREIQLPIDDAVRIASEVAEALAVAHGDDVIHRDIKPANILLDGGHAVVADFGIARGIGEAEEETLTRTGIAIGTPAYMSPEQAAAEAPVDGRSDVYALACVLYEMLTGEPPYTGRTAQAVIAKRLSDPIPSVRRLRPAVPQPLADAVTRGLQPVPADRFPTAQSFAAAMTRAEPNRVGRTAGLYALAALAVFGVVYVLTDWLGLPTWFRTWSATLLVIGLPTVGMADLLPPARGRWWTRRLAVLAGVSAFAGLGLVTAGYMGMRLLGIGPAGTLFAEGVLAERDQVVLADFTDRTGDSTLAVAVTEALRVDLGQSPAIDLMGSGAVGGALRRMERAPGTPLDVDLARELAIREGVEAVVTGQIASVAGSYVFSTRLLAAGSGDELVAVRETAGDSTEIVASIDRLSAELRKRIGESLRTVRRTRALHRVTTPSLPALRRYSLGARAVARGDRFRAIELYREALTIDTAFAAAYRALSVELSNLSLERTESVEAMTAAFRHRRRLTERAQLVLEQLYYSTVTHEYELAARASRSVLEMDTTADALMALGNVYSLSREFQRADEAFRRGLELSPRDVFLHFNLTWSLLARHDLEAAGAALEGLLGVVPNHYIVAFLGGLAASLGGDYEGAEEIWRRGLAEHADNPTAVFELTSALLSHDALLGRLASSQERGPVLQAAAAGLGSPSRQVALDGVLANRDVEIGMDGPGAVARLDSAIAAHPLSEMDVLDRPYALLALVYAKAGRPDRARSLLDAFEADVSPELRHGQEPFVREALGWIALTEERVADAIDHFTRADVGHCYGCGLYGLGRAYELAANVDSAVAAYERYLTSIIPQREAPGAWWPTSRVYRRLGELYEQRGDAEKAAERYASFVQLWKDADARFQPDVADARSRIARLEAAGG